MNYQNLRDLWANYRDPEWKKGELTSEEFARLRAILEEIEQEASEETSSFLKRLAALRKRQMLETCPELTRPEHILLQKELESFLEYSMYFGMALGVYCIEEFDGKQR